MAHFITPIANLCTNPAWNPPNGVSWKQAYASDSGADIGVPRGTPVRAMANGKIIYSEWGHTEFNDPRKGETPGSILVELDTPLVHQGVTYYYYWYTHLMSFSFTVRSGQYPPYVQDPPRRVTQGTVLGTTGFANTPHLHLGIIIRRAQRNGDFMPPFVTQDFIASLCANEGSAPTPPQPPAPPPKPETEPTITDKIYDTARSAEVKLTINRYVSKGKYDPYNYPVVDDITVTKEFLATASTCNFSLVVPDNPKEVTIGDHVQVLVNGVDLFSGLITSENIKYTYKQKKKNYYVKSFEATDIMTNLANNYEFAPLKDMTSTEVIKKMCGAYGVEVGELADTKVKIPILHQDNRQSCLTAFSRHLSETFKYTGINYILYSKGGKIYLKDIEDLISDIIVNPQTCIPVSYSQSIEKMYNCVIVMRENHKQLSTTEQAMAQDADSIARYGRRTKVVEEKNNADITLQQAADNILNYHKVIRKSLTIEDQPGDPYIIAGSTVFIDLPGLINHTLMVKRVTHKISGNEYSMDMEMFGGEYGDL